jgi:NTE family protein
MTLKNYGQTLSDSILMLNTKYRIAKANSYDFEKYFYCKTVEFFNNKQNKWIHVADGGISDNQGLQMILDQFQTNGIINKAVNNASPEHPLKRLIFINVNAGDDKKGKDCERQSPPKAVKVIGDCLTISLDRLSAKRWEEIKLRSNDKVEFLKANGVDMEPPYFIEINYRNACDSLKKLYRPVPVNFYLKKSQIQFFRSSIPVLMKENLELDRLKRSISVLQ